MERGDRGENTGRRIALEVQYDGTGFNGWQAQVNSRTVQQEIEKAIFILTGEECRLSCSGRTDAGVHALGQVAHFTCAGAISLQRLCIGLNGILPADVSVKNAYEVEHDFHSRFSAVQREYKYLIYNSPQRSPFMRYRSMWVKDPLDLDFMQAAGSHLIGEFDFSSFCKKKSVEKNPVREITVLEFVRKGEIIEMTVRGNAFLHNMIRIIVGTVLYLHKTGKAPDHMKSILDSKDRDVSGKTAPPYGLYLTRVIFIPELSARESAFHGSSPGGGAGAS